MATLDSLKWALRERATETTPSPQQSLSDTQYSAGYHILGQGYGFLAYLDFIRPQLSQLLAPVFNSCTHASVLEIGPGPTSVFGHLPAHLRRKVKKYAAFEPNNLLLRAWRNGFAQPRRHSGGYPSWEARQTFIEPHSSRTLTQGAGPAMENSKSSYSATACTA